MASRLASVGLLRRDRRVGAVERGPVIAVVEANQKVAGVDAWLSSIATSSMKAADLRRDDRDVAADIGVVGDFMNRPSVHQ